MSRAARIRWIVVLVCICGPETALMAQPNAASRNSSLAPGFVARDVKLSDGQTRRYAVFVPPRYDAKQKWPVVVFLHGSGERGSDGIRPTHIGLGPFLEKHRDKVPFIAVFPQGRDWFRGAEARAVFETLNAVEREFSCDLDRVYLTGISMGGFGTWELAMERPDLFAALIPICGGGPVEGAPRITHLPIWAFHGALDENVPIRLTREIAAAVKKAGGNARVTEFPNQKHACWDQAYNTDNLFRWLLQQKRKPPPNPVEIAFDANTFPVPSRVWWLRIDALEPGTKRLLIRAGITADAQVLLASEGIAAGAIVNAPLPPGRDRMQLVWNRNMVYDGPLRPEVPFGAPPAPKPEPTAPPTTQPATTTKPSTVQPLGDDALP